MMHKSGTISTEIGDRIECKWVCRVSNIVEWSQQDNTEQDSNQDKGKHDGKKRVPVNHNIHKVVNVGLI